MEYAALLGSPVQELLSSEPPTPKEWRVEPRLDPDFTSTQAVTDPAQYGWSVKRASEYLLWKTVQITGVELGILDINVSSGVGMRLPCVVSTGGHL